MHQMQSNFDSSLLMRVGKLKDIRSSYENQTLTFGCAANWIDYASKGNHTTGDFLEGTFAHLPKEDNTPFFDSHGKPMGNHLFIRESPKDGSRYICYVPTLLIPTMCFFSFNLEQIEKTEGIPYYPQCTSFLFNRYCERMEYSTAESAFLVIKDPKRFFDELSSLVPQLLEDNQESLTTTRYYQTGQSPSLFVDEVDYNRHREDEFYNDEANSCRALFWKYPKYYWQSEVRAIIANINFNQFYSPDYYDYKRNSLNIHLPHLKDYAVWFPANSISRIDIYRIEGSEGVYYSLV